MVFLGEWRPEQGHKPVASELWRRASITVHLRQARLEEGTDEVAHPLGSEPLRKGGRVDDVAKKDGNLLDFAGKSAHGPSHGPGGLGLLHIGRRCGRVPETRRID